MTPNWKVKRRENEAASTVIDKFGLSQQKRIKTNQKDSGLH